MKKKILSIILVLSILCAFVPVIAQAATSGECGDNLTWTLDGGTLTISGEGAMTDWDWGSDVPWYSSRSSIKNVIIGNSVTSIGNDAFIGYSSLESVVIPDSVTSIGEYAFCNCSNLESVVIPDSVTRIGGWAFKGCSGLTSVYYNAENCTSMGSYDYPVFGDCTAFKKVHIGNNVKSIPNYAFFNCSSLESVVIPDSVTSIGDGAFRGCSGLTGVTIGNSVTSIGYDAFYNCSSLESVVIPDSVTSIGSSAFYNCSSLTSIEIPDSVTSIGSSAFRGCSGLTGVTIGNSVASIGDWAFKGCSGLTSVYYNAENCTSMGSYDDPVFEDCTAFKEVNIGNNVKSIPNYAFRGCSSLESVVIPDSVTSIGEYAFYNCSSLESVVIPDSVTSIGRSAFRDCSSLTSIEIPDSVTSIGDWAFKGCSGLTSVYYNAENCTSMGSYDDPVFEDCTAFKEVHIGNNVKSIPNYAFRGCSSLTSVTIPNSVTSIGSSAFKGCSGLTSVYYNAQEYFPVFGSALTEIHLSDNVKTIPQNAFSDTAYYKDETNWENGLLYIDNCLVGAKSDITEVKLKDNCKVVAPSVFKDCKNLDAVYIPDLAAYLNINFGNNTSSPMYYANKLYLNNKRVAGTVIIPDGVTQIPYYAFGGCDGITSITIPDSVTSIGNYAFSGCSGLTSIEIPDSVTSIGGYAFCNCSSLKEITIPDSVTSIGGYAFCNCSSLTSVTIPDSVTSIGDRAFYECSSLTSVTIPDSVTSIGEYAFSGCGSLKNIYIPSLDWWIENYSNFESKPTGNIYADGELIKDLTIPDSLTAINGMFSNWSCLETVTIPSTVTSISEYAFSGCNNLKTVNYNAPKVYSKIFGSSSKNNLLLMVLGENVASIDTNAFSDCGNLKRIFIPKNVTEIESGAFSGCSKLATVEYGGSQADWIEIYIGTENENLTNANIVYNSPLTNTSLTDLDYLTYTKNDDNTITITDCNPTVTNINIPKKIDGLTVTAIGSFAFYNCNKLTTITIPNSIKSIGFEAFYNCNNLKDVYFTGTEAQWKDIGISWGNDNLTSANIHYNKTAPTPTPTPTPTYTIKYDANGGSGAPSNQSAKSGTTITVSSQIPKRTGYDFLGWSTSKTAETAIYNAGDSTTITSNRTLYAVWSKIPMPDTTGNEITISDAEINDNVVSFTLELVTTHTMQGTILVGVYDDNGTLVNIMSYPAKESNDISFTKQDNDSTVKVFWWYDSDIIFPMAKNAELALTDENAV